MTTLRVTQVKSTIGQSRRHEGTLRALGLGRIGKTGNARTVGCQLHFEVWPWGWERRHPVDPLPILRRWDRWS